MPSDRVCIHFAWCQSTVGMATCRIYKSHQGLALASKWTATKLNNFKVLHSFAQAWLQTNRLSWREPWPYFCKSVAMDCFNWLMRFEWLRPKEQAQLGWQGVTSFLVGVSWHSQNGLLSAKKHYVCISYCSCSKTIAQTKWTTSGRGGWFNSYHLTAVNDWQPGNSAVMLNDAWPHLTAKQDPNNIHCDMAGNIERAWHAFRFGDLTNLLQPCVNMHISRGNIRWECSVHRAQIAILDRSFSIDN